MAFKLLILLVGLIGTTLSSGSGAMRHGNAGDEEPTDAGFRAFGKVVSVFFVIAVLVIATVAILMLFSLFGAFEKETIDPPV